MKNYNDDFDKVMKQELKNLNWPRPSSGLKAKIMGICDEPENIDPSFFSQELSYGRKSVFASLLLCSFLGGLYWGTLNPTNNQTEEARLYMGTGTMLAYNILNK